MNKNLNKVRVFFVEFLAICLVILVSELLLDVFPNKLNINRELFLKTFYRAIRIGFFIRLLLVGLEYLDEYIKRKKHIT